MTPRQKQCLDFIRASFDEKEMAPSLSEIAAHMGFKSKSAVCRTLELLERDGLIKRNKGVVRGIKLVQQDNWQQIGELAQKVVKSMSIEHINDNGEGTVEVDAKAFGELDIAISENETL